MRITFSKIMFLFLHVNLCRKGDFYVFILKSYYMYLLPKLDPEYRFRETDGLKISNYIVLFCYLRKYVKGCCNLSHITKVNAQTFSREFRRETLRKPETI